MGDGINIMRTLGPGEGVMTQEEVTLHFLGRDWHVHAFIGDPANGGAVIIGAKKLETVDADVLASNFLTAACVCLIGEAEPNGDMLRRLAIALGYSFSHVAEKMADYKANRGKPS